MHNHSFWPLCQPWSTHCTLAYLLDLSGNPLLGSCMFLKPVKSVKPLWVLSVLAAASGCAQGPLCLPADPWLPLAAGSWGIPWAGSSEGAGCQGCPCSKEQTRGLREGGREPAQHQAAWATTHLSFRENVSLTLVPVSPVPHPPATPCWVQLPDSPSWHWKQLFGAPWAAPLFRLNQPWSSSLCSEANAQATTVFVSLHWAYCHLSVSCWWQAPNRTALCSGTDLIQSQTCQWAKHT